jgi:prolipoprotein diacylglyceryltransferase
MSAMGEAVTNPTSSRGGSRSEKTHAHLPHWLRTAPLQSGQARSGVLDRLSRTKIHVRNHGLPSFQVCGYTGVLAAIALTMTLARHLGLSYWAMGAIVGAAMVVFLALVFFTKLITGEEQIIYYHHEIAVMLVSALVAKALHQPVLAYVDVTILGIGAFLTCGRVGCLMVGCCHGRPFPWGIRYRQEHAQEGFAPYLVGITLFPIQALESLWVLFVVACGVTLLWRGQPPGTALAWYTISYGAARFSFEFIRGDVERPYTWGFSQGQWLSLWLMTALVWAEGSGRLSFHSWHAATLGGLVIVMLAVTVHRRFDQSQRFRILHPHHVREVAGLVGNASGATAPASRRLGQASGARVDCTSMGIQISHGRIDDPTVSADHYTLSQRSHAMSQPAAWLVADLILGLRRESRPGQLVSGNYGAFHLMLAHDRQNGAAI